MEEQRQVVGQWKRKAQKMTNEMNDLRMLLEEQNSRNNLLEKRQRKFDSECQALQVLYFEFLTGLLKSVESLIKCPLYRLGVFCALCRNELMTQGKS